MCNGNGSEIAVRAPSDVAPGFDTVGGFEALQRITKMFAYTASILPNEFKGEKNFGNCAIALEMAFRLGLPPMAVFQNLYIVGNKPAWSAAFMVACLNKTGKFSTLRYETVGEPGTDSWGCRAVAKELSTGETLQGSVITIKMAKDEGWYNKNGSKWRTMPEQMLRYRAASFFIRAFAPEIAMGLRTEDEVRDMEPAPVVQTTASELNAAISSAEPARKGRGRRARAEQAPAEEPAVDAVIVEPAPAPEPEPRPAPAADSLAGPRSAIAERCAAVGASSAGVVEACICRYPTLSTADAMSMLLKDDNVLRQCIADAMEAF